MADLLLLLARTTSRDEVEKPTHGMSVLLVDLREAVGNGLTVRPLETMLNHATTELFFDELRVPAENLIGEENKGFLVIMTNFNGERMAMAAGMEAMGRVCLEEAVAWAQERKTFGKRLADHQVIRQVARVFVPWDDRRLELAFSELSSDQLTRLPSNP